MSSAPGYSASANSSSLKTGVMKSTNKYSVVVTFLVAINAKMPNKQEGVREGGFILAHFRYRIHDGREGTVGE